MSRSERMAIQTRHPAFEVFADADFDLAPLERALESEDYRPFDLQDVAGIDSFLSGLIALLGREAVVEALRASEFAEEPDVLLFSIVEALPLIALRAVEGESASFAPEPVLRTLAAGVAENPDGAAGIVRMLETHGVSESAVAAIFDRAHLRVSGWRLFFIARRLIGQQDVRLVDLADDLAREEPAVFGHPRVVVRTLTDALRDGSLLVERSGRMPGALVCGAWASTSPFADLLAGASARVLKRRAFVGADGPEELGTRLWRCRR
jgi:hypothetical protein